MQPLEKKIPLNMCCVLGLNSAVPVVSFASQRSTSRVSCVGVGSGFRGGGGGKEIFYSGSCSLCSFAREKKIAFLKSLPENLHYFGRLRQPG